MTAIGVRARIEGSISGGANSMLPATGPEEHLHRQLVQSVFNRLAAVVRLPVRDDVVPAVPVQVRDGDE